MRNFYIRQLFVAMIALLCSVPASAHDFEVDGIYYYIDGNEVSVAYKGDNYDSYENEYSGDVVIPETVTYNGKTYSVTSIGICAFYGCTGLKSVTIPNSVTSIGHYAFWGCSGLTSITIPNSVTSIGYDAFYSCTGLTSITIPNSVTSIGGSAFEGCSGLTSIVVENGNTVYDSRNNCNAIIETKTNTLFLGCKNTIIPEDVKSIGNDAFFGCTGLKSIIIPNSVTSIGNDAFYYCSSLTSVTIPNSVTSIGEKTFYGCSSLKSVTIPNSVTSIGNDAFNGCSGLKTVTIPNSVTSIGYKAFYNCDNLRTVINLSSLTISKGSINNGYVGYYADKVITAPNGSIEGDFVWAKIDGDNTLCGYIGNATELSLPENYKGENYVIGDDAFYYCSGLTSVTIGNSVTSIGDYAFNGCRSLKDVYISDLAAWCNIDFKSVTSNPLYYSSNLYLNGELVKDLIIPNSVTSIGDYTFYGCSSLTSITIPNSVTSIGNYAFRGCSGLTSIVVENGNTVYDSRNNCNAIIETKTNALILGCKNTIIPEDVKSIGDDAFEGCTGLTSVTIPNSVTSIGDDAFYKCTGLTSITIGNSVTSIGEDAFEYCSRLKTVINLSSLTISKGSTDNGYVGYYADKVITVPNGSREGDFVWAKIDGDNTLCVYIGNATELSLPENYKGENYVIANSAFYSCRSLTSVTIPNSVTSIGDKAFYNCDNLRNVINLSSLRIYKGSTDNGYVGYRADKVINAPNGSIEGDFVWAKIDVHNTLCGYIGNAKELSLPENYKGKNYVIGELAFYKCSSLTSVTIPNSVTSIGNSAFYNCSSLTSVTIPNSVTSIGDYTFYGCSSLTSATIGNSITSIGNSAFYNCSGLTNITIPNSVTSIGKEAFYGCKNLKSVHIPDITDIGTRVFDNCDNLTNVSLNCKRVGDIISGNSRIKELVLGNNVIGILDNALNGCSGIRTIKITKSTPPKVGTGNFTSSHYQNATLYVPKGSLTAYQSAEVWKDFWDIQEFDVTDINAASADATVKVNGNSIALVGAENCSVAIYSTNSALIEKIDAYAGEEIILEKGVYIICIGSKSIKVKL